MIRVLLALVLLVVAGAPARAAVEIQEVTSPSGITAWLVEEPSIPFTAIELRFRGGASLDPEGKRGATNLMTALLEEGAAERDARAFAAAREALAAEYRFEAYDDSVAVSARFLSENRDEAVALLRSALVEPRFDDDAIERVRAQVLASIRSDATDPGTIASDRFAAEAWGDHPYGQPLSGTLDSVTALDRADLVAAHDAVLARDRVYVAAVGDIDAETLGEVIDELLADLPEEGAPFPPEATYQLSGGTTLVPFETPQSVSIFGHEGIDRHDPDYFAAYIVNEIFGGAGFESRLMQEVRVDRGLTYGIGSYLLPNEFGDLILGQFSSTNAAMAEAIGVVRNEWQEIAGEGITEAELDAAKRYLTGAYALRFDGNATIARIMVGMQMIGLPIDYIATRNANIEAVTLEEANRVAARIYDPDALHFVVVGQPEGLEAGN